MINLSIIFTISYYSTLILSYELYLHIIIIFFFGYMKMCKAASKVNCRYVQTIWNDLAHWITLARTLLANAPHEEWSRSLRSEAKKYGCTAKIRYTIFQQDHTLLAVIYFLYEHTPYKHFLIQRKRINHTNIETIKPRLLRYLFCFCPFFPSRYTTTIFVCCVVRFTS